MNLIDILHFLSVPLLLLTFLFVQNLIIIFTIIII
jgi:hypothetical protein